MNEVNVSLCNAAQSTPHSAALELLQVVNQNSLVPGASVAVASRSSSSSCFWPALNNIYGFLYFAAALNDTALYRDLHGSIVMLSNFLRLTIRCSSHFYFLL